MNMKLRHCVSVWALGLISLAGVAFAQQTVPADGFRVNAYQQPLNTPQEFVLTKGMQAGLAVEPVHIDLGEWSGLKSVSQGPMLLVGQSREISQTQSTQALSSMLQWRASANGGSVAAISVRSGGAEGMRLGVVVDQLPGNALLRLYTDHQPNAVFEIAGQRVMQILQANLDAGDRSEAGRTWWTPSNSGDQVTLEIELPAGTLREALKIALPRVMHIYENLSLPIGDEAGAAIDEKTMPLGNPLTCHLDATCYSQYDMQRRGVARMAYITERGADGSYSYGLCTGALLNDYQSSRTPYFLTAAHCISSQTLASALETDWFYSSSSCGSNSLSPNSVNLRNGAQLLYSSANPDVTLLKLNDVPPAGAYFLGWDSNPVPLSSSVVGIHHPDGGLQKISMGVTPLRANCTPRGGNFNCSIGGSTGNYYYVQWSQGLTQPGSSGSPLFYQGLVTGVLSGGSTASCPASDATSIYPSLSSVFPELRKWLVDANAKPNSDPARVPVYRFLNTQTGSHFFTADASERNHLIANSPVFQYENIAFYASKQSVTAPDAVYRFYNTSANSHFYTINEDERRSVIANYPAFREEGISWYARKTEGEGSIAMYRFYNMNTGSHFYTINVSERDFVIANYTHLRFEGTSYYVWSSQ